MFTLTNLPLSRSQSLKNITCVIYKKKNVLNLPNYQSVRGLPTSQVLRETSGYANFEKSIVKQLISVSQAYFKLNLGSSSIQLGKIYHPEKYYASPAIRRKVYTKFNKSVELLKISEAYQGLSEDIKRMDFDIIDFSKDTKNRIYKDGFNIDSDKIFKEFMEGTDKTVFDCRTGEDVMLKLTFEEAAYGASKYVSLYIKDICDYCKGRKTIRRPNRVICQNCRGPLRCACRYYKELNLQEDVCSKCEGVGKSVHKKRMTIVIPPGVEDGQVLRTAVGDNEVYIRLEVEKSIQFTRRGADVHSSVEITKERAFVGGPITVEGLYGFEEIHIHPGTSSDRVRILRGKGITSGCGNYYGDHYVHVKIVTPEVDNQIGRLSELSFGEKKDKPTEIFNNLQKSTTEEEDFVEYYDSFYENDDDFDEYDDDLQSVNFKSCVVIIHDD